MQDAFGLANFRFDKAINRVERLGGNGARAQSHATNVIVLREGKVYFEGPADEMLNSSDEYLKKYLASAE